MSGVPHARAALTSAGLAALAHWLLAAHRPLATPDATNALALPVLAYSIAGRATDALTLSIPIAQDVAAGAWLVLALSAAVATSWLLHLGLPTALAVAFGVGATFLRTPWSSHTAGRDALLLLGGLLIARALTTPTQPSRTSIRIVGAVILVLVTYQPSLVWLFAPLCLLLPGLSRRERGLWTGLAIASALTAALVHASLVRNSDACLAGAGLTTWLAAAMVPGRVPGASTWTSIARATTALLTNIHVFGLAAAAWALWLVGDRFRGPRGLTFVSVATLLPAATVGAVTTETFVWVGLVIWLPWYALSGHALWNHAEGRWRVPGRIAVVALAVLLPVGRHAVGVPAPMTTDAPHVRRHADDARTDAAMRVVGDLAEARLARAAGRAIVPLDASLITACLARGHDVIASGPVVQTLRAGGADLVDLPFAVPVSTLLEDVRPGAVVAFGATSSAMRWLRPADSAGLGALGLSTDGIRTRRAQALVVSVPAAVDGRTGPQADVARTDVVTSVAGRTLWSPLAVTTSPDGVLVEAQSPGPIPLVHGRTSALAVFDRAETPVVRGTGSTEPGLPITVYSSLPQLNRARVVAWPVASVDAGTAMRVALRPLLPGGGTLVVDDDTHRTVPVHVGDGWHDPEPSGRAFFRWSARAGATATLRLHRPSPLLVTVDAAPAQTLDRPNTLRLFVNGIPVGEPLQGATTVDVPAAATRAGANTLTFATRVIVPAGVVPGEPRTLGAIVRHIRVVQR